MIEINGIDAADADEAWLVVGPLIAEAEPGPAKTENVHRRII